MTTFDEREQSYERKFQQEQELAFKVRARRNHLLGLWAAGEIGLKGDAAEAYARSLIAAEVGAPPAGVVDKVVADLAQNGVARDRARVALELERCDREAKHQLGVPG